MQRPPNISTALWDALESQSQRLNVCVEIYPNNVTPGANGFNPASASLRVANKTLTFLGNSYTRYVEKVGRVNRTITEKFNTVSVDLNNHDRTMAAFVLDTVDPLEGTFLVVRIVSRAFTASSLLDSFVIFTGKCEKVFDATNQKIVISAKQYIGSVEQEIPWRTFDSEDEEGRAITDPEYEGFPFTPQNVTVQYSERVPRGGLLGALGFKKTVQRTIQYTSQKEAQDDQVVPLVLGRANVKLIPITSLDVGGAINSIMAACEGPILQWFDHRILTPNFNGPFGSYYRLGYPGGTQDQFPLTPAEGGNFYAGNSYYSNTAWTAFFVNGTDVSVQEPAPESAAIIMGMVIEMPDASGDFTLTGWTDNPAFITRWALTHTDVLNLDPAFINDPQCVKTACYCDYPVLDTTNGEVIVLPSDQSANYGVFFRRYRSTSLFTPEYFKHYFLDTPQDPLPELVLPSTENGIVIFNNPLGALPTIDPVPLVRRRFSFNGYLRERMKTPDFLFKVLLPTFRGYITQNARGKLDIKCKRPADRTIIRSASIVGATQIAVNNILPWVSSLDGEVIIGNDLLTSEVREVTSTAYTTAANSITLAVTGNLTASGATFSGGTSSTPATGSVTVTGLGTLTVTIDGHAVSYTTVAADTTSTAAAMLAQFLRADLTFQSYIKITWDKTTPTVISFESKMGFLNLASSLQEDHDLNEEVLRIQMSFSDRLYTPADLLASNILRNSVRWPVGGRQSSINRIDGTFTDSPRDFKAQPVRHRDQDHIDQIKKTNPQTVNLTGVDNFNQAKRLTASILAELRDLDFFMQHSSDCRALLLEEGDLICNTHASGGFRNMALRIEEITLDPSDMTVDILARRYSTSAYSDTAEARVVPLPSTLFSSMPPSILFNTTDFPPDGLIQTTASEGITSVRGGALFGESVFAQQAKVSVKRPGESFFTQIAVVVPDSNREAIFEFIASVEGIYTVRLEVCFVGGACHTTKPTASIVVGFGTLFGMAKEGGTQMAKEGGVIMEKEHG